MDLETLYWKSGLGDKDNGDFPYLCVLCPGQKYDNTFLKRDRQHW